jgi:hypothetical protein
VELRIARFIEQTEDLTSNSGSEEAANVGHVKRSAGVLIDYRYQDGTPALRSTYPTPRGITTRRQRTARTEIPGKQHKGKR